jgi:hypothetical protein
VAGIFSVTFHGMLALGALVWARESVWLDPYRGPMERPQPYPLHYVVLLPAPSPPSVPPGQPSSRPVAARQQSRELAPGPREPPMTGAVVAPAPQDPSTGAVESRVQMEEIGPGEVASIAGAGSTPIDYARVDQRDQIKVGEIDVGEIDPEGPDGRASIEYGDRPGTIQVAELVGPAATACPALRRADSEQHRQVTVSVGFDVDVHGAVDPASLHVVQSPAKPQTEHRRYAHMYAVAIGAKVDPALPDAEPVYDSVVTRDVRQHIAALHFRPALRDGRPIRSSVLVSCQSP